MGTAHGSQPVANQRITVAAEAPITGVGSTTDPITMDAGFGEPQHEDGAIYRYPNLLDFGPVNEPPPVVTTKSSRNLDLIAHWYNDFGLDKQALAANQAAGAYAWYDWRWNFPTNTGDGQTSYGYDPQRHPLQGFYKGDDPRVLGWQCKWLAEAGINAVSLVQSDGFKRANGAGVDWSNPASGAYWIYRLFNQTPNFQALRWVGWLDSNGTPEQLAAQVDELVWLWQNYPNGYTHTENGRTYAVLYLWDGEMLRGALDNYNGATKTLAHLRTVAGKFQALGYDGVMVMARNAGVVNTNYDAYGLYDDGVLYGYANYSEMYSPPAGASYNNDYSQYAAKVQFPVDTAGKGRRVIGVQTAHETVHPHPSNFSIANSTPAAFGLALRRAADHVVEHDLRRIITIGNVSEWAEQGPGLLPTVADGFGYLEQVRSLPSYDAPGRSTVSVTPHVQNLGWMTPVSGGMTAGTEGRALRLEALRLGLNNTELPGGIEASGHVQNAGWLPYVPGGGLVGTEGRSLRMEALRIRLTGDAATAYDVYYRVHVQNLGWLGWAINGKPAGTAGYGYRAEAVQVSLVVRGDPHPPTTSPAYFAR
ncbi:hypothetical protein L1785_02775 [Antribacter sp. KLBMP9083]|uniref:Uncharacterized protein n=1 Tax=Antribacter soli TaxID=2910976 RepID=A0AA41UA85_9MICO|nr:hypothetical protein [Antribacter soli]